VADPHRGRKFPEQEQTGVTRGEASLGSGTVGNALVGSAYAGIVVSDRWNGYSHLDPTSAHDRGDPFPALT
jgi:hypothetical protein